MLRMNVCIHYTYMFHETLFIDEGQRSLHAKDMGVWVHGFDAAPPLTAPSAM